LQLLWLDQSKIIRNKAGVWQPYLQCALAAAHCIVIGSVCMWMRECVCGCYHVTMITRNCVHRSSSNWVCR